MNIKLKSVAVALTFACFQTNVNAKALSFEFLAQMPSTAELAELRQTLVTGAVKSGNLIEGLTEQGKNAYANYRYDLASGALQRILAVDPDNIEANYYLGLMSVDSGEFDITDTILARIPQSSTYHRLLMTYKDIHNQRSSEYQRAKLLAKAGRYELALEQYQALFSHGIPAPDIAIDYLIIESKIDATRAKALLGLHQLNTEFNNVTRYQIELADHISNDQSNYVLKRAIYRRYLSDNNYGKHAAKSWLNMVDDLESSEKTIADIALIEKQFSDDKEILGEINEIKSLKVASLIQKRDPIYQANMAATQLYENENYEQAKVKIDTVINSGRADDETYGLLGHIETQLGNSYPALKAYGQAVAKSRDAKSRSHWQSYRDESEYWTTLALANKAMSAENYFEAQQLFSQAVTLISTYAEAYIGLADAYYSRGKFELALETYRLSLKKEPNNVNALEGEFNSLIELRGVHYALAQYDLKPRAQQQLIETLVRNTKYENELSQFDEALESGQTQRAKSLINNLSSYGVSDPWVRRKIALGLISVGETEKANSLMQRWFYTNKTAEMAHAYSLYLSGLDQVSEAIDVLNQVNEQNFTPAMHSSLRRLKLERRLNLITSQYDKSHGIANSQIQNLLREFHDDSQLRFTVLRSWFSMGEEYRARVALKSDAPMPTDPKSVQLEYLDLLLAFGLVDDFEMMSAEWDYTNETNLSADQLAQWRALAIESQLEQAATWREQGNTQKSIALYRRVLSISDEQPMSVKIALLSALVDQNGATKEALRLSDEMYQYRKKLDIEDAKTLASILDDIDRNEESTTLLKELSLLASNDRDLMSDLLAIAVSKRNWNLAPKFAAKALITEPSAKINEDTLYDAYHEKDDSAVGDRIRSNVDTLQEQSTVELAIGYQTSENGNKNIQYTIPMEVSFPIEGVDGKFFVRADLLNLDTGEINQVDYRNNRSETALDEQFSGQIYGVGFRGDNWSGDIGRLDFGSDSTLVGGLTLPFEFNSVGFDVTLSRRPVTSTVVSFSGVESSVGGPNGRGDIEWGMVTKTGLKVDLSYDEGGAWGGWMSGQVHQLTGENVEDNQRLALLGGVYHKVINNDDERLSISLSSLMLAYDNNQDEYSYGLGGYYSPQSYFSLSVPVNYAKRIVPNAFIWAGAGISYSTVNSDGIFNTDEESSSSQSWGMSGELGIQTRLYRHWDLGFKLSGQYSDDYKPLEIQLYSRYYINQLWSNGDLTPNTITRYAEFD